MDTRDQIIRDLRALGVREGDTVLMHSSMKSLGTKETPEYFDMAKAVLKKYNGKDIKKARTMKVDAVSGATMSSEALIKNVQEGLRYYEENK